MSFDPLAFLDSLFQWFGDLRNVFSLCTAVGLCGLTWCYFLRLGRAFSDSSEGLNSDLIPDVYLDPWEKEGDYDPS